MSKKRNRNKQPQKAPKTPAQQLTALESEQPGPQLEAAPTVSSTKIPLPPTSLNPESAGPGVPDEDDIASGSRPQALREDHLKDTTRIEEQPVTPPRNAAEPRAAKAQIDESREELEAEWELIEEERKRLESGRAEVRAQIAAVIEREERLEAREADADSGFADRRQESLSTLQQAHEALLERGREQYAIASERELAHLERLAQLQAEHEKKLEALRRESEARSKDREAALLETEGAVRTRERELERALFDAREAERDAEDLKAHVEEYIEERTEERVVSASQKLEAARRDCEALRSRIVELEQILVEREAAGQIFENMSPEAVKARIDNLQHRIGDLENDLADRPSAAEAEELQTLREERTEWERDRQTYLAEKDRWQGRRERLRIEVDKVQNLRDRNTALLENQRLLKAAIDDLSAEVDGLVEKREGKSVFPVMLGMDEDADLNQGTSKLFPRNGEIDLCEFAVDLRHRIGKDLNDARPELYYRDEDIRAFLGGLAMSRLHIVQGISGIGKSSLPEAFADAVGGFCETIPVQAGWRDRNDLLGYFNTFERRYHELPFTQAIYRAGTPRWKDRIVIVLLDEMNLSHPEQYAADLLVVLASKDKNDADASKRKFELLSFTPKGEKPTLLEKGRFLRLPPNVWFVGTANHDETTKDFADKTYDRSFVLELPSIPEQVALSKQRQREPVSCQKLSDAFDRACTEHAAVATAALNWMHQNLRKPMNEWFRVNWGGRLEDQIRRFVPVVFAAGGGLGEALDRIITSRVLRKIKGRRTNTPEDLENLVNVLKMNWPDTSRGPDDALQLLDDEIPRG